MNHPSRFLLKWLAAFVLLVLFDMAWFYVSVPVLYKPMFNDIQKKFVFRVWSGIVVWVLIALFIALQACSANTCGVDPRVLGFVYGFIIYGVYNFTNYATLHRYNLRVALSDSLWGTLNIGTTSILVAMMIAN